MNKESIITAVIAIVFVAGILIFYAIGRSATPSQPPVASSTQSSGTSSSTSNSTPPTPSPIPTEKGTVNGSVVLGPTCPVEHIPPDPNCAPRPYQTTIRMQHANPSAHYLTALTDASGTFSISLDPGAYTLHAEGQNNSYYPRCTDAQIQIAAGASQTITIDCDTGIR